MDFICNKNGKKLTLEMKTFPDFSLGNRPIFQTLDVYDSMNHSTEWEQRFILNFGTSFLHFEAGFLLQAIYTRTIISLWGSKTSYRY